MFVINKLFFSFLTNTSIYKTTGYYLQTPRALLRIAPPPCAPFTPERNDLSLFSKSKLIIHHRRVPSGRHPVSPTCSNTTANTSSASYIRRRSDPSEVVYNLTVYRTLLYSSTCLRRFDYVYRFHRFRALLSTVPIASLLLVQIQFSNRDTWPITTTVYYYCNLSARKENI